ncbi:hypothetical protein PT287_04110 [Lactobacillus sp. ESL0679]|uniref:hypothetical protein n=1 Tax=Lactobacillus sp. ESL0679 TaxID=2983209 RepID=UPI0023F7E5B3|nr:hypothetical protein [Lactobacillus sp. ESL0679]MDF7682709.1 hypothetical protein [Lactobacillus sp. ESL0679]
MTVFKHLFKELFKQKRRNANAVIIIQFVAAMAILLITVCNLIINKDFSSEDWRDIEPLSYILFGLFSFVALPIYLIVTCVKNERFNRSQTWRLAPVNDEMFYLDNILSSFASVIYLMVAQFVITAVLVGLSSLLFKDVFNDTIKSFVNGFKAGSGLHFNIVVGNVLQIICFIILFSLFTYLIISFLNFATRSIMDYLPGMSSKTGVFIVQVVLIILIMRLLTTLFKIFGRLITSPMGLLGSASTGLGKAILIYLVLDIALLLINMFLINKFFEAAPNK